MLQQGAVGFLQKPFRFAELADAVGEAVEGKRVIQDARFMMHVGSCLPTPDPES
jgi:FixJ family two-component response regulator